MEVHQKNSFSQINLPFQLPTDFHDPQFIAFSPFGFFQTITFLFSSAEFLSDSLIRLRCYEDSFWGNIHFNNAVACDSTWQVTGIADINKKQMPIELFPNPATESIALHFTEQQGKSYQITITDMQGRILQNKTCYAAGNYLLHIQQNGKRIGSKLFIKQ
jgi:hypothetical protein